MFAASKGAIKLNTREWKVVDDVASNCVDDNGLGFRD
jgi:hypothetical protein